MSEYRTLRDFQMEQLADRTAAINYLQVTLEEYQVDGDMPFFLREIRTVLEAQGGIAKLAKRTDIEPAVLSEMLTSDAAPRLDMFSSILTALGCRLSIQPLEATECSTESVAGEMSIVSSKLSSPNPEVVEEKG
ncbi:MAG: transcriptional regulator [Candidatus Poribacteria bacterium]|nr:transcriptional regulator [Candidatus Poribacteria bacterium]